MANLKLTDGTLSFEWQITGLGSPFNSSNYKRVGISTEAASSAGQDSKPGTIIAEQPAPSSGSSINTDTYKKSYPPGKYTFYGWAYSGGRYWPAGSDEVTVKDEPINATYSYTRYATSISFTVSNLLNGQYGYCYVTDSATGTPIWNKSSENRFDATKDGDSKTITLGGLNPDTSYNINVGVWTSGGYTSKLLSSTSQTIKTLKPVLSKSSVSSNGFKVKLTNTTNIDSNIAYFIDEVDSYGNKKLAIADGKLVRASENYEYTTTEFSCADGYKMHWNTKYEVYAKIGTWQSDTITITTSNFLQSSISISPVTTTNTTASFTVSGIPAGFWVNIIHNDDVLDSAISSGSSEDVDIYVDGLIPGAEYTLVVQVNTWRTELGNRQKTITITTKSPGFDCEILSTKIIVNAYNLTGERVFFYVYEGWISDGSIDRDNNYGYDILLNGSSTATCVANGLKSGTKYTVNISNGSFEGEAEEVTTLIPTFKVTDVGELNVSVSVTGVEPGDDITVFIRTGSNINDSGQTTCHNTVYRDSGENRYSVSTDSYGITTAYVKDIYGSIRRIQPGTLHSINVKVNEGGWLNGGGDNGKLSKEFKTDPLSTTYTRTPKRDSITFNVESIPSPSNVWFYINRVTFDDNDDESFTVVEEIITSSTPDNNIEVWDGSLNKTFTSTEHPNLKQGYYYVCNVHIKYDGVTHDVGRSKRFGLYERPENWEWESIVQKDALIRIRAEEWNNFTKRINAFRTYSGLKEGDFTDAIGGITKIGATICNKAYDAIYFIDGRGTLPDKAVAKKPISASFFNKLMTALNAVP